MKIAHGRSSVSGYTIFEIVLVISLMGILSVMTVPHYFDLNDEARKQVELSQVAAIREGIAIYAAKSGASGSAAFFPSTLGDASIGQGGPDNALFSNVLEVGVMQDNWSKLAGRRYRAPSGTVYTYNPSSGSFLP
jgi:type II secretory pathway pseudopilin PulG